MLVLPICTGTLLRLSAECWRIFDVMAWSRSIQTPEAVSRSATVRRCGRWHPRRGTEWSVNDWCYAMPSIEWRDVWRHRLDNSVMVLGILAK